MVELKFFFHRKFVGFFDRNTDKSLTLPLESPSLKKYVLANI